MCRIFQKNSKYFYKNIKKLQKIGQNLGSILIPSLPSVPKLLTGVGTTVHCGNSICYGVRRAAPIAATIIWRRWGRRAQRAALPPQGEVLYRAVARGVLFPLDGLNSRFVKRVKSTLVLFFADIEKITCGWGKFRRSSSGLQYEPGLVNTSCDA